MTVPAAVDRATLEAVKIEALARGVRVAPELVARLGGEASLTVHEYATTGGITVELPDDVLINAPFDEPFCASSELELIDTDGELWLTGVGTDTPVLRVLPLPGYLAATTATGALPSGPAMSHADRIRLSPIAGCAYDCRFCNVAAERYGETPIAEVIAALDVALADDALPPRHLLISGGSAPVRNARGQAYFVDTCLAVLAYVQAHCPSDFKVDVMMSARSDGPEFVDRLVEAGVDGFSLNIEVFSDTWAHERLPLKHKWSRAHLEPMIVRAVERLGRERARVRSLIIPGLEPAEDTLAGVAWLASLGCSPVLSPFRAARGTALAAAPPVKPALLRRVLDGAREIVAREGVLLAPHCVACQHNTLSFPWDVT